MNAVQGLLLLSAVVMLFLFLDWLFDKVKKDWRPTDWEIEEMMRKQKNG